MGKSHNLPFNDSHTKYSKPLKLITTDLWGSAPMCSDYGYKYYISFVDAHTRYTWAYFLKNKSDAYRVMINFITLIEK